MPRVAVSVGGVDGVWQLDLAFDSVVLDDLDYA